MGKTKDPQEGEPIPERPPSQLGDRKDFRNCMFPDALLYRNTVLEKEPLPKNFTPKHKPDPWQKEEKKPEDEEIYTPFKGRNGRRTPQPQPEMEAADFDPQRRPGKAEFCAVNFKVEAPPLPRADKDGINPVATTIEVQQPNKKVIRRGPSRAGSVNGNYGRLGFQPLQPPVPHGPGMMQQAPGMVWVTPQPMYAFPVGQKVAPPPHGQAVIPPESMQIPRIPSRASSEIGTREMPASYIAATLPRMPLDNQTPQQKSAEMLDRYIDPPMDNSKRMSATPPSKGSSAELRATPLEYKGSNTHLNGHVAFAPMPESKRSHSQDSTNHSQDNFAFAPIKDNDEEGDTVLIYLSIPAMERLSTLQLVLGICIFAVGVARLLLFSAWAVGLGVVYGVFVMMAGVLGVLGTRKQHYCSLIAAFVMSLLACILAIGPFVSGLMVTVPNTFSRFNDSSMKKWFESEDEPMEIDILLSALCLVQVIVSILISVLACKFGARLMQIQNHALKLQSTVSRASQD